jgi:ABC-type Zn uptake system ZnuABC Zn-binding protein ZnuA
MKMRLSSGIAAVATAIAAVALLGTAAHAADPIRVVATIPDLADIAQRIGGERVEVTSLTRGTEDFHMVRPRPSLLVSLARADLIIEAGLDLEHAWLPALLKSARNDRILPGGDGFINVSAGIEPLDVPEATTRQAGPDLHPRGNPHFNLSPARVRTIADNILVGLVRRAPDGKSTFEANHRKFIEELEARRALWREQLAPLRGAAFIEYHASWSYFAEEFGLRIVARLEPKPGVSPSPEYLAEVIEIARREKVGLIVARPANEDLARKVAKEVGATAVVLTLASTTEGETAGYLAFIDHAVAQFAAHLRR